MLVLESKFSFFNQTIEGGESLLDWNYHIRCKV